MKNLVEENSDLRKDAAELAKIKAGHIKEDLLKSAETIHGIRFISGKLDLDAEAIKNIAFELRSSGDNVFLILANESEEKAGLTIAISDELIRTKKLNAGTMIREIAEDIREEAEASLTLLPPEGRILQEYRLQLKKRKQFCS